MTKRILLAAVAAMLALPAQAQYTYPPSYTPPLPGVTQYSMGPLQGYPPQPPPMYPRERFNGSILNAPDVYPAYPPCYPYCGGYAVPIMPRYYRRYR